MSAEILDKHHPGWDDPNTEENVCDGDERMARVLEFLPPWDSTMGTKENPWPMAVTFLDQPLWWSRKNMSNLSILEELVGESVETEAMRVGTDFHEALENIMLGEVFDGERYGRFHFECDIDLPLVQVAESPLQMDIETPEGWVQLRGKVDGYVGNEIIDYKTKSGKNLNGDNVIDYMNSCQWKSYIWMAGVPKYEVFRYHVFDLSKRRGTDEYDVKDHHNIEFWWKDGMENDVIEHAAHCLRICKNLGYQPNKKRSMLEF